MPRHIHGVFFFLLALVFVGLTSPAGAADGKITSRVSLKDTNGNVVYGDWVRVFLVTEVIDIPRLDLAGADAKVERTSRINSAHMTFFIRFREMMDHDSYLINDKLTRPDGAVAFNQVPPGRYYLVITFPTMIAGQKAAWQVAVDVVADRTIHVDMNSANMILKGF